MHRPPAVSFPVGRSRWHGIVLLLVGALAWLTLPGVALLAGTEFPAWAAWAQWLLVLCTGAAAAWAWCRSPTGVLRWDGEHWLWSCRQETSVHGMRMVLDFQGLVLVSLSLVPRKPVWLWLERAHGTSAAWRALRRALVYSASHAPLAASQPAQASSVPP